MTAGSGGSEQFDGCYYCGRPVEECGAICPNCSRQLKERARQARVTDAQSAAECRRLQAERGQR